MSNPEKVNTERIDFLECNKEKANLFYHRQARVKGEGEGKSLRPVGRNCLAQCPQTDPSYFSDKEPFSSPWK
jgi:hypothetical protein